MIALFALIGLAVGSFLNLCSDRLPRGQSILSPLSRCDECGHPLAAIDLVPLLSYLWLGGRCRYCSTPLPPRLPLVELTAGLLFAFLFWWYGLSLQLFMALVYACLLIVIFVIDLEHGLILDRVIYPAMALAVVFSFFWPGISSFWPKIGVASSLLGGVAAMLFMLVPFLVYPGGMGGGDVKLAAFGGLATGFPQALLFVIISAIGGGLVAAFLLIFGLRKRRDPIPFGPFLASAIMVTLIWGEGIVNWYLGLF